MSGSVQAKSNRLIHLDLLRLIAIFLVIFNHTGERGYILFISKMGSPISLLYMAASVFCKIAVPLFFMISGALLLKKEESLKQLFLCERRKNVIFPKTVQSPVVFAP
jgi:surface polysaccharide O-acyltransferase-like enzyme